MRLKISTFAIVVILGVNNAHSQQVSHPQITPPAPEEARLIRNVQYPVSYTHGSVDISIPLYEIIVGDVVIPISLSYNHKGLRPFEFTHYLGQGWSLSAVPSISRKANGQPDKKFKHAFPGNKEPNSPLTWSDMYQIHIGNIDAYPDEYYYNIPGKSGAFVFKHPAPDSGVAVFPFEPIRVEHSPDECITIIDDDGTIYSFGLPEYSASTQKAASSWKCTKISTPRGSVTFTYLIDYGVLSQSISEFAMIDEEFQENPAFPGKPEQYKNLPHLFQFDKFSNSNQEYHLTKTGNEGESQEWEFARQKAYEHSLGGINKDKYNTNRIETINFPGGRVVFNHASINSRPTLSGISVFNDTNELIREVVFTHRSILQEYQNKPASSGDQYDYPILKSVSISGGGLDEKYDFEYYGGGFPYLDIYSIQGPSLNFWGYWTAYADEEPVRYIHKDRHGVNFYKGTNTIFTDEYYLSAGNGNRLGTVQKNGMLKIITTKSGSQTTFEYESDKFEREEITHGDGRKRTIGIESGGLRIKKITQHDGDPAKAVERHFEYGSPERIMENGVWKDVPSGVGYTTESITTGLYTASYLYRDATHNNLEWRQWIINGNILGDITFSGVPIVYSQVTEYTKGYVQGSLQNFGKTVRYYNYASPGTSGRIEGTGLAFDNLYRSWTKDYLKAEVIYKYDGIVNGTEKWTEVQSSHYLYTAFLQDDIPTLQVWKTMDYMDNHHSPYPYEIGGYRHRMTPGSQMLAKRIDSLFLSHGGHVVTQTAYSYNDGTAHKDNLAHLYPLSAATAESDGTVQTQSFKYVQDATGITDTEHRNAVASMISKNIVRPVIEQTESAGTHSRTTYNMYTTNVSKSPASLPVIQKLSVKDSDMGITEDRIVYHTYDPVGNPLYATKDGTTNVVYLWGYDRRKFVAVIENATEVQVLSALVEGGYNTSTIYSLSIDNNNFDSVMNALRKSTALKDASITTFKHRPMVGIEKITDPRGITVFYIYDAKGRLTLVNDHDGNPIKAYHYNIKGN